MQACPQLGHALGHVASRLYLCTYRPLQEVGTGVGLQRQQEKCDEPASETAMSDIRAAGDLTRLKKTGHVDRVKLVESSIKTLVTQKMIPQSAGVSMESLTAAYTLLTSISGNTNQERCKARHKEAESRVTLKSSVDLVTTSTPPHWRWEKSRALVFPPSSSWALAP